MPETREEIAGPARQTPGHSPRHPPDLLSELPERPTGRHRCPKPGGGAIEGDSTRPDGWPRHRNGRIRDESRPRTGPVGAALGTSGRSRPGIDPRRSAERARDCEIGRHPARTGPDFARHGGAERLASPPDGCETDGKGVGEVPGRRRFGAEWGGHEG